MTSAITVPVTHEGTTEQIKAAVTHDPGDTTAEYNAARIAAIAAACVALWGAGALRWDAARGYLWEAKA